MKKYQNIMIALEADGSEKYVVEHAVLLAEQLQAKLAIIHVNDLHAGSMSMMMDSPKIITADMTRTGHRLWIGAYFR